MVGLGSLRAKIAMKIYSNSHQLSSIVFIFLVVVSVLFVAFSHWGSAQTVAAQAQTDKPTKGLTLSPLRSELNIAPGTLFDGVLTVTNSTKKPMTVNLSAEKFSVINQQYDYAFTAESNETKWINFSSSEVNLLPDASKKITFTIGVPLSAEPGGRYISLFASTDTGVSSGGVESRQRVASLLYITVTGDVSRDGHLVSLTSPWFISAKSTWNTALQNTGSTHFRSRYNIKLNNLFWYGTSANMSGDALILPGTVRSVSDTLPAPKWPGIYKIVYTIGLGDTPAVTETRFIIYMPMWVILVCVAIIVILALALHRRRKTKTG